MLRQDTPNQHLDHAKVGQNLAWGLPQEVSSSISGSGAIITPKISSRAGKTLIWEKSASPPAESDPLRLSPPRTPPLVNNINNITVTFKEVLPPALRQNVHRLRKLRALPVIRRPLRRRACGSTGTRSPASKHPASSHQAQPASSQPASQPASPGERGVQLRPKKAQGWEGNQCLN